MYVQGIYQLKVKMTIELHIVGFVSVLVRAHSFLEILVEVITKNMFSFSHTKKKVINGRSQALLNLWLERKKLL